MTSIPGEQVLADHTLLLAIPAFFPAIIVVGVVVFVAMRDRRRRDDDDETDPGSTHSADSASADEDR